MTISSWLSSIARDTCVSKCRLEVDWTTRWSPLFKGHEAFIQQLPELRETQRTPLLAPTSTFAAYHPTAGGSVILWGPFHKLAPPTPPPPPLPLHTPTSPD